MRQVILRIDDGADPQGRACYALSLHVETADDWLTRPVATATLPLDLGGAAGSAPDLTAAAIRDALQSEHVESGLLPAVGDYLRDLLCRSDIGPAWTQAMIAAQEDGVTPEELRLFFDIKPERLRGLPWELITGPAGGPPEHVFLSPNRLCLRGSYQAVTSDHLPVPVRVLVVVGNPHDKYLRADDEVDAIMAAVRRYPGEWHLEVLQGPTSEQFFDCFEQVRPHVFHFIGHAATADYGGEPELEFRPQPGGETWPLTPYAIRNSLQAHVPRLVFLNACRTAEWSDKGETDPRGAARGVADVFERLGACGVLAMQADIPSELAVKFTHAVYRALADGAPLDVAVRSGRRALFRDGREPVKRTWAVPSLTVRSAPEQVLPIRLALNREQAHSFMRRHQLDVVQIVDRTSEHRMLWDRLDRDLTERPPLLVTGEERMGKSVLVQSCLFTGYLRGDQVAYVNLTKDRNLRWWDVLRGVGQALLAYLPDRADRPRRRFGHALACLRDGVDPPGDVLESQWRIDDGGPWLPRSEREPELRAQALSAALEMIRETAGGRPLTLAIDHLGSVLEKDVADILDEHFLLPLALRKVEPVTLVLIEETAKAKMLFSQELRRRMVNIVVPPFEPSMRLLRDYAVATRQPFVGDWQDLSEFVLRRFEVLKPKELLWIADAFHPAEEVMV